MEEHISCLHFYLPSISDIHIISIQKLENEDNGLDYKNIYLNEHLTPYISNLAYKCRCLKRKGKIAKAKVRRGGVVKIMVEDIDGAEWQTVLSEDDISDFLPIESDPE